MISVIIPFKDTNIEFFNLLIKSLNNQTVKDFEVIFVDDNSINENIYKKIIFENGYKYIKNNQIKNDINPGKCRDIGLENAKGDLIWFVDSDDIIISDAIEYINKTFKENKDIDFLMFKFERVFKKEELNKVLNYGNKIFIEKKIELVYDKYSNLNQWWLDDFQTCWRKVVKKEFLLKNKIRHHKNLKIFEDVYYDLLLKNYAKKIFCTNKVMYFYNRISANTLINKENEKNRWKLILESIVTFFDEINNKNEFNEISLYTMNYYYSFFYRNKFNSLLERKEIFKKYINKKHKYKNWKTLRSFKKYIAINCLSIIWVIFGTTFFIRSYKLGSIFPK